MEKKKIFYVSEKYFLREFIARWWIQLPIILRSIVRDGNSPIVFKTSESQAENASDI